MLEKINSSDLLNIYLKFCSRKEFIALRLVSKTLNKNIPKEWTLSETYVVKNDKNLIKFLTKSHTNILYDYQYMVKYKYCKHFFLSSLDIETIIFREEYPKLKEINIVSCPNAKKIVIEDHYKRLKYLNINNLPVCINVKIPNISSLKSVNISGTFIEELVIPDSCVELRSLILMRNKKLKTIIISKNSEKLCNININGSENVRDVYLHQKLDTILYFVENFDFEQNILTIHSRTENRYMIWNLDRNWNFENLY